MLYVVPRYCNPRVVDEIRDWLKGQCPGHYTIRRQAPRHPFHKFREVRFHNAYGNDFISRYGMQAANFSDGFGPLKDRLYPPRVRRPFKRKFLTRYVAIPKKSRFARRFLTGGANTIVFDNPVDAVMFKLRWHDEAMPMRNILK